MKTKYSTLISLLAVFFLTNCSPKGFSSKDVASSTGQTAQGSNPSSGGSTNNPADPNTPNQSLANVDLTGQVDSNQANYNKALAFDFDKKRGEFIVMIPMPSGVIFSPSGAFSKYPDITFSPMIDAEGRMKFAIRIPVKYIIKGVQFSNPATLPNGDQLPAMPQGYGELPSIAINFPQHNNTQVYLYVGVNAIGVYVTLPPNAALPIGFTLPIKNKDKSKTFGYLTYVPSKMNYAPGLFVSTIIPPEISRILEDYFKL